MFNSFQNIFSAAPVPQKNCFEQNKNERVPNEMKKPIETSDCYKIVMVLDESGSMNNIRSQMIKAINDLIEEQKTVKDRPCKFTLVKFNNTISPIVKNLDLQEVSLLNMSDYTPNAMTALNDAIGHTINWFRYETNVLLVIITDGQENSSSDYKHNDIMKMLDEKQKHRDWSYVYLCNDLTTSVQGNNLGLKTSKYTTNVMCEQACYGDYISKNLNEAIKTCRKTGMSVQSQLNN